MFQAIQSPKFFVFKLGENRLKLKMLNSKKKKMVILSPLICPHRASSFKFARVWLDSDV